MKTYKVNAREILERTIEVVAENEDEAVNIVKAMYRDEQIVLDAEDCLETRVELHDES